MKGPRKGPSKNVNAQIFTFLARSKFVSLLFVKLRGFSYHGRRRDRG
jgi:hypothetical protein